MALHLAQVPEQRVRERIAVLEAGKTGEALQPFAIGRQRVGLIVGHHLQAMLDGAQEFVGGVEIGAGIAADPAALRERGQRRQRFAAAQLGMAAAGDELLGLREELDLADAAAAELDVVAFDRDILVAAIGVDLALHRLDVGHRGEVEIFPPDERRELRQDRLAGRDVAGAGARLDQRRALPVLADAAVVVQRRLGRDRDRASRPGSGRSRRSTRNT